MPYLVNCQKLIGWPLCAATPSTTTLALAADGGAVAAQVGAERERPPQRLPGTGVGRRATSSSTTGAMVATYGMLSKNAPSTAEPNSSAVAARK